MAGGSGRLVERQQHQPRRHFRAETEQAAVEGHHPAWKQAAGGGQGGHRGFLQERVDAAPLVGHINAVVGAGLSRLTNGHAAHPLPAPVDSGRVESQNHVAGADHQAGRQPLHPGGGKGQHFVEHRAGLAPGSFHGQRAEQLAGERVLRKAARIAAGVDHEHALSCPPVFETAGRSRGFSRQDAQCVQGGAAASDPPVFEIRHHEIGRAGRDPALRLTPAQFRLVALGLPPRAGRDHDGRPPRRRRPRRRPRTPRRGAGLCGLPRRVRRRDSRAPQRLPYAATVEDPGCIAAASASAQRICPRR